MIKTWRQRLTETWATIDALRAPVGQVNALKAYHANLTSNQREQVSQAMAQGDYAVNPLGKPMEKSLRAYRRALILVLMAKSNSGNFATDLQRAQAALQANTTSDMAQQRVRNELTDLPTAVLTMLARGNADENWAGWDGTMHRPLLAGCAIGRRGANGPGTLGCFVTRGADVFILSNRHVLYQAGAASLGADTDLIQPPHQLGGSYFDVVADTVEDDPVHDAAIARVRTGITCSNTTPEGIAITGAGVARFDHLVTKRGCATRARRGVVVEENSANVDNGTHTLVDQLLVEIDALDPHHGRIFQIQGDSGSVILNHANQVVALAHGQFGAAGVQATHIAPILAHFGVQVLVGQMVAP